MIVNSIQMGRYIFEKHIKKKKRRKKNGDIKEVSLIEIEEERDL